MARTAWRFVDPVTTQEYVWEVNPYSDSGSFAKNKNFAYTVAAGSRQDSFGAHTVDNLIYQTNKEQSTFSYDGFVYNKNQYDALEAWSNKNYPIELYDDLGRGNLVYVTEISFSRVRSTKDPYKHSYKITGIILGEL